MILIEEKKSSKLPNLTSLYFKLDFINNEIEDSLKQQAISYYDEKTNTRELPINRLFYLINLLSKYDDVKFIPYKKPTKKLKKVTNNFKVKPFSYQLEGIEYGLNHDG